MRFLLLVLTLLLPVAAQAQLNGFYTIGGSSPDYTTISAAVADLNAQGVSGPTRFAIRAGTYTEQISIDAITGTSAADTVQFRAANPSNRPTIQFNATSGANYVWRIADSDHVKLRNLDFVETGTDANARVLVVEGDSDDLSVAGCTFTGLAGATTDAGTLLYAETNQAHRLVVTGGTFTDGYRGIEAGSGSVPFPDGHVYRGNTLSGQYDAGVYASGVTAFIDANAVSDAAGSSAFYTAVECLLDGSSEITRNDIRMTQGRRGIELSLTSQKLIANNTVSLRSPNGEAGIYLNGNAYRVDVFHNTVRVGSPTGTGVALLRKSFSTTSQADIDIKNNLLLHYASGTALEIEDPANVDSLDSNNLFRTGGGTLVAWGGTNYATLAAYQSGTGQGANSISKGIDFADASSGDLRLAGASEDDFDLAGMPVGIAEDIDGDARAPMNPKMGADEGVPFFPLDGTYSVGLPGFSDFGDPFEAVAYLNTFGTSGPVLFDILAFDYTGQATIEDFERFGAPDDTVTFRGTFIDEPGFPRPTLRYAASGSADNYILRLDGADFISIEKLEFDAIGSSNIGRLLVLDEGTDGQGTDDLTVRENTFKGIVWVGPAGNPGGAEHIATIDNATGGHDRARFLDNTFTDGTNGIRLSPTDDPAARNEDVEVSGNTFTDLRSSAMFAHTPAIVVHGNTVTSDEGGGFQLFYGDGGCTITENRITLGVPSFTGLNLRVEGTEMEPCLVANNFVSADRPMRIDGGSSFVRVLHNTLYSKDERVLWVPNASDVTVLNNILYHSAGGFAFEASGTAIAEADHNALFTTGSTLARVGGVNYADLAAYQSGTGSGANSVSKVITFVDAANGDLHLDGPSDGDDDLAGTPLVEVIADIDGEDRGNPPYMGADEASGLTPPVNYDLVATNTTPLTVAPGGSISFDYSISNNTANPATGNLWFVAKRNGNTVAQGVIVSGTLPGGQTFNGSYTQPVPGAAPAGTYDYDLNIGSFPGLVVDTESFVVTVTGSAREAGADSWAVTDATPWPSFDETEEAAEDGTEASSGSLPEAFALEAAYPNPFSRSATVGFALPEAADVRVAVYDVLGREVTVLVDGPLEAGRHAVPFEAANLASGVYLVRMVADGFAVVQRVTLAR